MNAVAVNSMPSITMLKFQHLQAAIAGTHAQACPRTSLDRKLGINMISSARSPPPWPVRGLHPCSLQPLARGITSVILSQQALTPTSVDAVAAAPWHLTDTPLSPSPSSDWLPWRVHTSVVNDGEGALPKVACNDHHMRSLWPRMRMTCTCVSGGTSPRSQAKRKS